MSSSFYEDASLVMIPSGYKTSKVYCAKPTDGAGDLTFTRSNDTATRVASNGLIEKVRTNLALQSNTFSSASWTKFGGVTVTSGQAGYDGTNNAWLITKPAAGFTGVGQAHSNTGVITGSFYLKAGTLTKATVRLIGTPDVNVIFDLANGVIFGGTSTGWLARTITSVGNGWYRCSLALNATASSTFIVYPDEITNTTAGTIFAQNAQLEAGDIATDPILTTTAAVSVGPVANVPRLDYLNSSCPRLLLEPQRQNVCLWSEQIDNAGWIKTNAPTITTNIATAPDGYGGADGIQDTTGSTFKRINQNFSVSANSTVTASVFVKKETTETNYGGMALLFSGGTTNVAYSIVDAVNGTATLNTGTIGSASTKIEDYGTYYRVTLTATDSGSNTTVGFSYYGTLSTNGTTTGTSAGSVRKVWGFQVEIGASYATSYIPTLGAAVTRGADLASASYTGLTTTSGSLFFDLKKGFAGQGINSSVASLGLRFSSTGTQDSVGLRDATSGTLQGVMRVGGTGSNLGAVISGTAATKICFVWTASNVKMFKDGALFGSASISTPAVFNTTELPNSVRTVSAPLAQFLIFPTALSDADAIALTA